MPQKELDTILTELRDFVNNAVKVKKKMTA